MGLFIVGSLDCISNSIIVLRQQMQSVFGEMVHDPVMLSKRCNQETKMLGAPCVGVTLVGQEREAEESDSGRE